MAPFTAKYTKAQKDALAHAYRERNIRPARLVVDLAARGELEWNGEKLDPFETNEDQVRHLGRLLKKRRHGEQTSQLAQLPPRDAIEALRRRLVNAADAMLTDLEDQLEKEAGKADPERLRQITRAVREAAALPGPNDPRPTAPGAKVNGHRDGAETTGGLAGGILKAHRTSQRGEGAQTETATTPTQTQRSTGDSSDVGQQHSAATDNTPQNDREAASPGAPVRALAERVGVQLGEVS